MNFRCNSTSLKFLEQACRPHVFLRGLWPLTERLKDLLKSCRAAFRIAQQGELSRLRDTTAIEGANWRTAAARPEPRTKAWRVWTAHACRGGPLMWVSSWLSFRIITMGRGVSRPAAGPLFGPSCLAGASWRCRAVFAYCEPAEVYQLPQLTAHTGWASAGLQPVGLRKWNEEIVPCSNPKVKGF